MLPVLVCLALAWLIRNAVEDVAYAVKGKTSPRRKYRQERWRARQARTGEDAPNSTGFWRKGPARQYLFDAWSDAWADAGTKRADRAADKRAAYAEARAKELADREQAKKDKAAQDAADKAKQAADKRPLPKRRPSPYPPGHPGAPTATAPVAIVEPDTEPVAQTVPTDPVPEPIAVPTPSPQELADMFARPAFTRTADSTEPASTPTTEVPAMTSPAANAEVSGHDSAKIYAEAMSKAAAAAVASLEQTIASMTKGKVGAPAIGHLMQAKEHAGQMTASFQAALGVLSKHDVVREGYSAAPDAGDKDWMTRE